MRDQNNIASTKDQKSKAQDTRKNKMISGKESKKNVRKKNLKRFREQKSERNAKKMKHPPSVVVVILCRHAGGQ